MRRPRRQEVAALDDEALLRLVVARRSDAFEELYRRHAFAVTAVAGRVTANRPAADEATQAAFLALWRRAATIHVEGTSLRAWLVTVGRNAAIDGSRRLRLTAPLDAGYDRIATRDAGPEEIAVHRETQRDIRSALAALEPEQRAVVELAYFGGLSQTEIAAATGVPLGTVKGRVRLAMRHLRRTLETPAGELA